MNTPTGPDEVIKLAYEEACTALRAQDATLDKVRNRTTGLLAATAIGTSIASAAAVGLVDNDPGPGQAMPGWAAWSLLLLAAVFGAGVVVVLWPAPRWLFGLGPARLLEAAGEDIDLVRRVTTQAMIAALASNDRVLARQMAVYRLVVGLTLVLVVLFVALILSRV